MRTKGRLGASLTAILGVIIAMVAFSGPANAAYGDQPTTSVSDQTPAAGSSLTFCGSGFQPGETVTIVLDNGTTYPSVTADAAGDFCTTIVLGASLSGTHTLTATGTTSGITASTTIQVLGVSANAGPTGGGLAFTGAAVIGIGALGGLLLVGGGMILFATRRRKVNA
ncbi:MAG TPA: hypothetical protein VES02_04365 [Dermatophilaceae bacterium]|nr:hypothetical protein [Dermatophilaceae bacterium]